MIHLTWFMSFPIIIHTVSPGKSCVFSEITLTMLESIYDCEKRHSVHLYELSEIIKQQIKINLERKRKKIALLCNSK